MFQAIDLSALPEVTEPIAALGAFGVSAGLGLVKRHTSIMDGWLGRKLRPVQPVLIAAGAVGLPLLSQALGIGAVDAATFAAAPTATIAAIVAREVLKAIRGR